MKSKTERSMRMKKRITALVLALGMSVQMTGSVQAQAMEDNPADVPEVSYVIMAEDADEVQEVTGTEIQEEDSVETGDCEIVAVELTEEEAEALEKLDLVIEEDIPFSASALNDGSTEGTSGSQDAPETVQEPGTAQEAEGETTDNPRRYTDITGHGQSRKHRGTGKQRFTGGTGRAGEHGRAGHLRRNRETENSGRNQTAGRTWGKRRIGIPGRSWGSGHL